MENKKYIMAFTTGGLFLRESVLAAELFKSSRDWDTVKKDIQENNLFQSRTAAALCRITSEVLKRLRLLSNLETEFLLEAARPDQQALLWVAVCRRYSFIAEFATEVIREKYLSLNYELSYEDFDWFFNKKADWFPDLDELTPSTRKKLRQVLFRILREADLLSTDNKITPILFSSQFVKLIQEENSQELFYFPLLERNLQRNAMIIDKSKLPLQERLQHLFSVISSERFQKKQGLGNEVPFFICPYNTKDGVAMEKIQKLLVNQLEKDGLQVLTINLYDLSIEILKKREVWNRVLTIETTVSKNELKELLQGILDPENHLIPAISDKMNEQVFDVMFISGVGEVFPYIRSHNVLNNLQRAAKEKPTVMFFPGAYVHTLESGASLDLFGKLKDDKYYRAFNIYHYEV